MAWSLRKVVRLLTLTRLLLSSKFGCSQRIMVVVNPLEGHNINGDREFVFLVAFRMKMGRELEMVDPFRSHLMLLYLVPSRSR
ncbi:hypothetical protein F4820DRAFT_251015 [Hypoxylon rubiginosum]|uniref:Uncharacterized protein n=1 Tax=Hypoxylon rubiginosum TaxID=110542 RepID=A0ACB9Z5M9_9PEZI|nr:hypothetical protein F4820DRAFT_251015 [Hypoxylon rubiginosum]